MNVKVRRYTKGDEKQLLELFGGIYRYNPRLRESDYLDWQFNAGPFTEGDGYHLWLAGVDGKISSFIGYVPVEFRYEGRIQQGCWPQNWASIGGDYSGLAVLTALMKEYDSLFYSGLSDMTTQIFEKLNIPILMKIPRWIGVLDDKKVQEIFKVTAVKDRQLLQKSVGELRRCKPSDDIYRCERFEPGEEFSFEHWPEIAGYTRRTGKFLNWRYFDIPRHNYQALRSEKGEFAIYRLETIKGYKEKVVRILEWSFSDDDAAGAMGLLVKEALQEGAILLDFFCTAGSVGKELKRLGFLSEDSLQGEIPFLFRPIKYDRGIAVAVDMPPHRQKRSVDFSRWYITRGDSDIDRIKL